MAQREPKPPYRPKPPEEDVEVTERVERTFERRTQPVERSIEPRVERDIEPSAERVERDIEPRVERVERARPIRPVTERHAHVRVVRSPITRLVHAVDWVFTVLYGLLGIRLVLTLMGASSSASFTRLIGSLTEPFYAPFRGIVDRPTVDGGYVDFPIIVALLAYALLHLAIRGLLRVIQGKAPTR